ncbi:hypothetical protein [Bacillus cereus]|uniref:hypothetical protein n=1 Tax=Bacillus cereus TaxID=1396 RepID=UPI0034D66224
MSVIVADLVIEEKEGRKRPVTSGQIVVINSPLSLLLTCRSIARKIGKLGEDIARKGRFVQRFTNVFVSIKSVKSNIVRALTGHVVNTP